VRSSIAQPKKKSMWGREKIDEKGKTAGAGNFTDLI
jgi:hypothetical protein